MPPTSSELIAAVKHPLRRRILLAYVDGSVERTSASELAQATGRRMEEVSYHLKMLAKWGILRPVPGGGDAGAKGAHVAWVLAAEPEWLRLVLEVWAEAASPADQARRNS